MERINNFLQDESGGSAVEYGLLIALIALACIMGINRLGWNITYPLYIVEYALKGTF